MGHLSSESEFHNSSMTILPLNISVLLLRARYFWQVVEHICIQEMEMFEIHQKQ